ncbi:MAG: hypothetical protein ACD_37C00191G0002 [uncultured bacterium]|nr:MAG: hypothetical protein ACD_37C00191G0002 [uncultured bacterium]
MAPASISAFAPSLVAIFPPITSIFGYLFFINLITSIICLLYPCALSTTITEVPAFTNASTLSSNPTPAPTAAPTNNFWADTFFT